MKGIHTVKRKHGTAVYISYSPPGEPRVRELFQLVKRGANFDTELRLAKRRASPSRPLKRLGIESVFDTTDLAIRTPSDLRCRSKWN